MAADNFEYVITLLLASEGGYSDDPDDPGNWTGGKKGKGVLKGTKYGIAANSFPKLDIKNITQAQAKAIYRRQYWDAVRAGDLPHGVDYLVFDLAVNSGVVRAGLILQKALVKLGQKVTVDGHIGDRTIQAVEAVSVSALADAVCDARLAFMRSLKIWPKYKNGWTRRVAEVREIAKAMAFGRSVALLPAQQAKAQGQVAISKTAEGQAVGVATGSAALSGLSEALSTAASTIAPLADALEVAKWVFLGLTVASAGVGLWVAVRKINSPEPAVA